MYICTFPNNINAHLKVDIHLRTYTYMNVYIHSSSSTDKLSSIKVAVY